MTKEKLGILSSFNELCGNASYTKALAEGLKQHYDVTVVPLNVELLRKEQSKSAKTHMKKVCEQLATFDRVNIQFEAGLFGATLKSIRKRFFQAAKASKNLVITMHRVHDKERYPAITFLGKCLLTGKFKRLVIAYQNTYANNRHTKLYNKVVRYCKRKGIPIIVHTKRDRELIEVKLNYDKVFDHPLCFYDQEYIESVAKSFSRSDFCKSHSLEEDKIYIGIFGFISAYKGHDTVIRALEFLPRNYEVLIFGAQHPHTIRLQEPINDYIDALLKLIRNTKVSNRVKFYGLLNDEDFLKALLACDFNILPYLEVNQGGSAIAALSLETNSQTIFSQNCAFYELSKYAPNSFKMFTIGNHLELANAIKTYRKAEFTPHLSAYHEKYNINTSAALYKQLLSR